MKKPRQHFIPRVYLKNFAHTSDGEKHFVAAYNTKETRLKPSISIRDICIETDLYTLNHLGASGKYKIEDFFSDNIESVYPRVYQMLVQDKKEFITPEDRYEILSTVLSMYFRTPKVLNQFVEFSARIVENVKQGSGAKVMDFLGHTISLEDKSFTEIKKDIKEKSRINYLATQLGLMHQFIQFRLGDGLAVYELMGDYEFLTSDNPVAIGNETDKGFNLFDAGNSIFVPLDRKHALYIAPKHAGSVLNQVFYDQRDEMAAYIQNHMVSKNSERWIIGSESAIQRFLIEDVENTKPLSDNDPRLILMTWKEKTMRELAEISERGISNDNAELLTFLDKTVRHYLYPKAEDIQRLVERMINGGIRVNMP